MSTKIKKSLLFIVLLISFLSLLYIPILRGAFIFGVVCYALWRLAGWVYD